MKKTALLTLVLLSASIAAQDIGTATGALGNAIMVQAETATHLQLALSCSDYPVTAGDIYRLVYSQGGAQAAMQDIQISSDYGIDLEFMGKVDASGKTFLELKKELEDLISSNYKRSMPTLTISAPGVFRVTVTGALPRNQYIQAWGLTRLSEALKDVDCSQASRRRVTILSKGGARKDYDLVLASRGSRLDQDPRLRPDDTIILNPLGKVVSVSGQVRQPGTYELLPGEGLKDLLDLLSGGMTSQAEAGRVRVDVRNGGQSSSVQIALPEGYAAAPSMEAADAVYVPSKAELLPLFWIEGAIIPPETRAAAAATPAVTALSSGYPLQIHEGQSLADTLQSVRGWFRPDAELSGARLTREGQAKSIAVDLGPLLTSPGHEGDIPLKAGDRLFIPARLPVYVNGAVIQAGSFPYQEGASAAAYIAQAGGANPEQNDWGCFYVTDAAGHLKLGNPSIRPGDRIYVPYNGIRYNIERILPYLDTITTVWIAGYTIYDLFRSH